MRRKNVYIRMNADLVSWIEEQAQEVIRSKSNFIEYVLNLYRKNAERKAKNDQRFLIRRRLFSRRLMRRFYCLGVI